MYCIHKNGPWALVHLSKGFRIYVVNGLPKFHDEKEVMSKSPYQSIVDNLICLMVAIRPWELCVYSYETLVRNIGKQLK